MEYNGYHFVGKSLRDGRPVPKDGETLIHSGEIKWCKSGLYASPTAWDALKYAPGNTLCRVNCRDIVKRGDDKFVCRERTIVDRRDITQILRKFSRECAMDAIHLWDAPDIVIKYLKSGDENLRNSARDAAMDAAMDAARAAAWAAARAAAWAAARDAARDAAMDAAGAAAWAAAMAAAWAAAMAATRDAAMAAARAATRAATRDAAWAAARQNQKQRFNKMVDEEFNK